MNNFVRMPFAVPVSVTRLSTAHIAGEFAGGQVTLPKPLWREGGETDGIEASM
jgi:hypothetical protein